MISKVCGSAPILYASRILFVCTLLYSNCPMKAEELIGTEQGGAHIEASKYEEVSIQRGPKRFNARALSAAQATDHQRVLIDTSEEENPNSLQTLGLTKREAEVLHWVSQGKRNREIAQILGARPRTVGKHVERILGKLGVETRTAAASIAAEFLHLRCFASSQTQAQE